MLVQTEEASGGTRTPPLEDRTTMLLPSQKDRIFFLYCEKANILLVYPLDNMHELFVIEQSKFPRNPCNFK